MDKRSCQITDMDVARYFIEKDTDKIFFSPNALKSKNSRTFYAGNARLNKYLHLAQNIYIAKYGKPLFKTTFYAYDNGVVSKEVQENYQKLLKTAQPSNIQDSKTAHFLDMIYDIFGEASIDELIELSHEDPEWQEKHGHYRLEDERMDSMAHASEYKKQYADIVEYIDRVSK